MTKALQTLPDVDETAIKDRINTVLKRLGTNEDIAEFYDDLRAQISRRRAQLETELIFEVNFCKAAEAHFMKRMEEAHAKRLPSSSFDITIEAKREKQYDAKSLYAALEDVLPKEEFEKGCFTELVYKSNGTELNKLVRAYGADSPVGLAVEVHCCMIEGKPKIKIERKEKAISVTS